MASKRLTQPGEAPGATVVIWPLVPDGDFNRFERVAARHGMNRSEFYRRAAQRFADELEGRSALTEEANEALAQAGQSADRLFLRESERIVGEGTEW